MTDRPILMSAPMVRALLDGRKTQTRRLAWRMSKVDPGVASAPCSTIWQSAKPGGRLWVRENHAFVGGGDPGLLLCEADWRETAERLRCENIPDKRPRWTPSIHMPRWASRITLVVTATKMERVQEISEEDCEAEAAVGIHCWDCTMGYDLDGSFHPDQKCQCGDTSVQETYGRLWQCLHTKPGARWEDNPKVVALTFTVHQQNIDAMGEAA